MPLMEQRRHDDEIFTRLRNIEIQQEKILGMIGTALSRMDGIEEKAVDRWTQLKGPYGNDGEIGNLTKEIRALKNLAAQAIGGLVVIVLVLKLVFKI